MEIKIFTFNPFGEHTYIVYDKTGECAIIDPGMMSDDENAELAEFIETHNLHPTHLINTHMHIDHVAGNNFVEKRYGLVAECNIEDAYLAERVKNQAQMFGIDYKGSDVVIGKQLNDGDVVSVGETELKVLHVPGHSKGHSALYCEADKRLFCGDVLFQMSIGRTDLPGGDYRTLLTSIETKLYTLPDDTIVLPGHGGATEIGFEKAHNPYTV